LTVFPCEINKLTTGKQQEQTDYFSIQYMKCIDQASQLTSALCQHGGTLACGVPVHTTCDAGGLPFVGLVVSIVAHLALCGCDVATRLAVTWAAIYIYIITAVHYEIGRSG
jgi:hypothetical protein